MRDPESVVDANVAPKTASLSQFERAVDDLDEQINELGDRIHVLAGRLSPSDNLDDADESGLSMRARLSGTRASAGAALKQRFARFAIPARSEWRPGSSIWWDVAAALIVVLVAGVLRFSDISGTPPGIQGDEAQAALQAEETWDLGWYGPWNPTMGGIPAGYIYAATPVVKVFGTNIESVRLLSASFDTIAALLVFVFLLRTFGFTTALGGGLFYATSAFAIQFGRTAFSLSLWPVLIVAGVAALSEALRSDRLTWWGAMAVCWGLAIYSYPGQSIYLIVLAISLAWLIFGWRTLPVIAFGALWYEFRGPLWLICAALAVAWFISGRQIRLARAWSRALVVGLAMLVAMSSMLRFMLDNRQLYLQRSRDLSIFRSDEWFTLQSTGDQLRFLFHRTGDYWEQLILHPLPNTVDGSGAAAFVPLGLALLAGTGLVFGVLRRWNAIVMLGLLTVLAAPALSIWSTDFALRRSLVIVPFVAMFAGLAVTEILRVAWKRNEAIRTIATVVVVAFCGFVIWRNYDNFFNKVANSNTMAWTFSVEFVDALRTTQGLPDDIYVYEWSGRWPWGQEIQVLELPDTPGEWRGEGAGNSDLTVDYSKGRPVFMLFHDYQQLLPQIQAMYPGGEVIVGPPFWEHPEVTAYTIYVLPVQP